MVAEELKRDPWGTLEDLAKHGYQGVETSLPFAETVSEAKEARKRLDDLGLAAAGLSCPHRNPEKLDEAIERALALGAPHILTYWGPVESEDQLRRDAEVLEAMAAKCREADLKYCYHNHDHEFSNRFGKNGSAYAIDILLDSAPSLYLQLDIAWCQFGGADPLRYLRHRGARIPVIHVKDLQDLAVRGRFSVVGTGVVDCFGCIEAAAAQGASWMVVEQDKPNRLAHYESAVASIWNIREAGLLLGA